jgi:hypothetical protein
MTASSTSRTAIKRVMNFGGDAATIRYLMAALTSPVADGLEPASTAPSITARPAASVPAVRAAASTQRVVTHAEQSVAREKS